jgi:2-polyprenyl-3-methyl-5-hydroxy-6-metoxy-1,4-benzoquinol methylase
MEKLPAARRTWSSYFSSTLSAFFPKLNSGDTWDREYARGDWDRLDAASELIRYAAVFGQIYRRPNSPAVLDVGCGTGKLLELVSLLGYEHYVGIDVSEQAIERSKALALPRSSFEVAFAESFATDRSFDVIVFNEVMYYLGDPVAVAKRYSGWLREQGLLVVSMYECGPANKVWKKLAPHFDTLHAARVTNECKHTWNVRVMKARA